MSSISPDIVTDGLVLCLDAADKKSYAGSGDTWYDRSGNDLDGTLENDPTFSTAAGGCIVLDGIDDRIQVPDSDGKFDVGTGDFTVGVWVYLPTDATHTYVHLFCFDSQSNFSLKATKYNASPPLALYFYGGSYRSYVDEFGTWDLEQDVWQYVALTRNGSTHKAYYNGDYVGAITETPKSLSVTNAYIGWGHGSEYTEQWRSNVQFYNKALTDAEVLQNFNAMRGRFGV